MSKKDESDNYERILLLPHEDNLLYKIKKNYNGIGDKISKFYKNEYLPMRKKMFDLTFDEDHPENFEKGVEIFNNYYFRCKDYAKKNEIRSQSKFESTCFEELSSYLFKDMPEIKHEKIGLYNKGIHAGLSLDNNFEPICKTKDVDFCIGKSSNLITTNNKKLNLICPIVAIEAKTYLDATMLGEIKSSSTAIIGANPAAKAYVLSGYKSIADEHIIIAKNTMPVSEIFILQDSASSPMNSDTVFNYWKEICDAVKDFHNSNVIPKSGRLFHPDN